MKRKLVCRKIAAVLLSAAVITCSALSVQNPFRSSAVGPDEEAVPFDCVDDLAEGTYSPNRINLLLKQAYSWDYDCLLEEIFSDPMFKEYEVLSDPATANPDAFRLFVTAELNSEGADAIRAALDYLGAFEEIYYAGPDQYFEIQTGGAVNAPRTVYDANGNSRPEPVNDPGACASAEGLTNYNGATNLSSAGAFDLIDLYEAWGITPGSPNFVLGNYETLYYNHEDLLGQMWNNPDPSATERHGYNFTNNSGSVYSEDNDHGTFTAGIMCAAGNNRKGSAGVAYGAKLMASMGSNVGSAVEFQKAINFMNEHEIKVYNISASWSKTVQEPVLSLIRQYKGLVVVCAHNQGVNLDEQPLYPASYSVMTDNVIAVGAVDNYDNNLWNYGPETVQIAAPCEVVGTGIYDEDGFIESNYGVACYTSAAAPVVSGVIALIWSANPTLSAQEVKQILLDSADHVSKLDGIIQGGRRVNAYKALLAASCKNGQYFFRSKSNGKYLNLDMKSAMLYTSDFNADATQQFYFGQGTLTSRAINAYISTGYAYKGGMRTSVMGVKTDIAVAKDLSGSGYRIIRPVRVPQDGGGEAVELYALEAKNAYSSCEDVIWKPYDPDSENQIWYAEDAAPVSLPDGIYTIQNVRSGQMLNMEQSSGSLMQYNANGLANQKWKLESKGIGQYILKTESELFKGQLANSGATPLISPNSSIKFYLYQNVDDMTGEPDGSYRIQRVGSKWCLKVQDDSLASCAPMTMDVFRNIGSDQWIFTKVG